VNDFKIYPPGLDAGSNERPFYNDNNAPANEKSDDNTSLTKRRAAGETGEVLNHKISMCCIVFGYEEGELKILLLESEAGSPFALELPGGLATSNQTLETSARQMVADLSGSERFFIEQVYSFGNPGGVLSNLGNNEPLGNTWEITVAFFALLNADSTSPSYAFTSSGAKWYSLKQINQLSAYQNMIVTRALNTLRFEIRHFPIAFELLPEKFTLLQVQSLYEAISGKKLDKRNFRKKLKSLNLVLPSGEKQKNIVARPSELFIFNRETYADSHNSIL